MKKTKCDGEFPCKRCKDDGLVCTAGTRKKTEYKQLPRGYAEVLENTQFALIATVHKLYAMVRSGQQWDLGEPDLNDRGQPVIHNIASKLGCIRPNSDMDLPVHSVFPEDEAGLAELAAQLEAQQREHDTHPGVKAETDSSCNRTDRASSSELDHSDFEQDYRKAAFGGNTVTLSPQSLSYDSFDGYSAPSESLATQSPTVPTSYAPWTAPRQATTMNFGPQQYFQQPNSYMDMDMLNQGLMESEFGTIKPHMLSCPNPEVMMGVGDPMIYSGYDGETLRL
ncbi:putative c6 transcription factor protein [Phaeoacremonium minimum UCRPA7]|uniref:Putative c6 transcription factor protein n=1 Tax=Phaeoacremonium minimum (strain UCR-PA7) TaxID=1286976 RepID=R8BJY5_PHAM7|nr:putative c6 transcription factor protein [Phaeoacremonium minimum UCRPA7]EON99668.1 putative c6 transcription factor protein [Phaeoacremonium minimum UCRPA7]